MSDNNNKGPVISHKERKLFTDSVGSGHFSTNGYFASDLENSVILEPTFSNKLHQSRDETKAFYSKLKNELLSYGATCLMGDAYELFRLYEKGIARLSLYCGRVRIRLEFDKKRTIKAFKKEVSNMENILVSNGYIEMFVDTDEKCVRAIDLIGVLMRDLKVDKNPKYVIVDFVSKYAIIENGIFSFIEDEKDVPELVVMGYGKGRRISILWLLVIIVALLSLITIGACELIETKREQEYPIFEITDMNGDPFLNPEFETIIPVDIFNNPQLGGQKVIYPGREDTYYFYVTNTNDFSYTCSINFSHINDDNINMVYRFRIADMYSGDDPWQDISEINKTNITVSPNGKILCALDWKWAESDKDTEIGEKGLATYTLTITFSDFNKLED